MMQTDAGATPGTKPDPEDGAFLWVRGLTKHFDITGGLVPRLLYGKRVVHAVEDRSFDLAEGETLGLVGESGSGKSTLARVIARLIPATAGEVHIDGHDVLRADPAEMKVIRKNVQFIFQDPFSSLNPRMRIERLIGRSLKIHFNMGPAARRDRVIELMEQVGLRADHIYRYPHEFSGGQRQRIAIARALASEPTMILADEPASSLDVSIQAQVLELLDGIRQRLGLTMIFITHDLNVAEFVSDQIAVMYGGRLMELGPTEQVLQRPLHPYSQSLLEARPHFGKRERLRPLEGEPAIPINPPIGCPFAHRCPIRIDDCTKADVDFVEKSPGHKVACIRV